MKRVWAISRNRVSSTAFHKRFSLDQGLQNPAAQAHAFLERTLLEQEAAHIDTGRVTRKSPVKPQSVSGGDISKDKEELATSILPHSNPRRLSRVDDLWLREPPSPANPTNQEQDLVKKLLRQDDYEKLKRTLPLPTALEFPYQDRRILRSLERYIVDHGHGRIELNAVYEQTTNAVHGCHLVWQDSDGTTFEAEGFGRTKRKAEKVAAVRLVSKLYLSGAVDDARQHEERLSCEVADAKVMVYNYAARFGVLPLTRSGQTHRSIPTYFCTVTLPLRGISVQASAATQESAEIFAFGKLRKITSRLDSSRRRTDWLHREKYRFPGLNAHNAGQFVQYCVQRNSGLKPLIKTEKRGLKGWRTSAYMGTQPIYDPTNAPTKQDSVSLGNLAIAIHILEKDPMLWKDYCNLPKRDDSSSVITPVTLSFGFTSKQKSHLQSALVRAQSFGLQALSTVSPVGKIHQSHALPRWTEVDGNEEIEQRSRYLKQQLNSPKDSSQMEQMSRLASKFQVRAVSGQILSRLHNNDVTVIHGPLRSGKSSQIPQIIFDEQIRSGYGGLFKMLSVTKTTRYAIHLKRSLSYRRPELFPDLISVVLDRNASDDLTGRGIMFCQMDYLTEQLVRHGHAALEGLTHLFLDDADTENNGFEILLTLVKQAVRVRKQRHLKLCKIILVHAGTPQYSDVLASYFADTGLQCTTFGLTQPSSASVRHVYLEEICATLAAHYDQKDFPLTHLDQRYIELERDIASSANSQGDGSGTWTGLAPEESRHPGVELVDNTFRERNAHLEDVARIPIPLTAAVLAHVLRRSRHGTVMVFLPTRNHILDMQKQLARSPLGLRFNASSGFETIVFTGQNQDYQGMRLRYTEQTKSRRIIFTTPYAEDFGDVGDVRFVIDLGTLCRARENGGLQIMWASKVNLYKRLQRVTALPDGQYLALFTQARAQSLSEHPFSNMGLELEKAALTFSTSPFGSDIRAVFKSTPYPPEPQVVERVLRKMAGTGALSSEHLPTALAQLCRALGRGTQEVKAILYGLFFGCHEPILVLTAMMGLIFAKEGHGAGTASHAFAGGMLSDHMAVYNAFDAYRRVRQSHGEVAAFQYAEATLLKVRLLMVIETNVERMQVALRATGGLDQYLTEDTVSEDAVLGIPEKSRILQLLLLTLRPTNIAVRVSSHEYCNAQGQISTIKLGSILHHRDRSLASTGLIFYEFSSASDDGRNMVMHRNTQLHPMSVLLFGGERLTVVNAQELELDGWLRFRFRTSDVEAATLIVEFRKAVHRILAHMVSNIGLDAPSRASQQIRTLLTRTLLKALSWDLGEVAVSLARQPERSVHLEQTPKTAETSEAEPKFASTAG